MRHTEQAEDVLRVLQWALAADANALAAADLEQEETCASAATVDQAELWRKLVQRSLAGGAAVLFGCLQGLPSLPSRAAADSSKLISLVESCMLDACLTLQTQQELQVNECIVENTINGTDRIQLTQLLEVPYRVTGVAWG